MESLLERSVKVTESKDMKSTTFKRRFQNQLPVVMKGAILHWEPCEIWKYNYLKSALKASFQSVSVLCSADNLHFIDHSDFTTKTYMTPEELIDRVFLSDRGEGDKFFIEAGKKGHNSTETLKNKKVYLRTSSMPDLLYKDIFKPEQVQSLADKIFLTSTDTVKTELSLIEDFSRKLFRQDTMQLWIGTPGNVTQLHYDRNHGLLAQVTGRKQIFLFSHEDTGNLYPYSSHTTKSHVSRVNLRQLDGMVDRFPKFSRADVYHCVIEKGDLLYIPPFWWHDVTSLDSCVSVTLPWDISTNEEIPPCMLR